MILSAHNVVANLVHTNFSSEIAQHGDVVNTRKPDLFTVAELGADAGTGDIATGALAFKGATSTNVAIALDEHWTVAFRITQRDQDTSIKNLVEEYMEPAVIPLAEKIDSDLLSTKVGVNATSDLSDIAANGLMSWDGGVTIAGQQIPCTNLASETAVTDAELAGIMKVLIDNKIPVNATGGSNVSWVVNSGHYQGLLANASLMKADSSGINPPQLKTGWVGSAMGMNVYVDQNTPKLDADVAASAIYSAAAWADEASVVFHKNALTFVTRPLETVGDNFGVRSATVERDGIGLRVMMSYDHTTMAWLVSLDILYGFKLLDSNLRMIASTGITA